MNIKNEEFGKREEKKERKKILEKRKKEIQGYKKES